MKMKGLLIGSVAVVGLGAMHIGSGKMKCPLQFLRDTHSTEQSATTKVATGMVVAKRLQQASVPFHREALCQAKAL